MSARLEKVTIALSLQTSFDDDVTISGQKFERPKRQGGIGNYSIFKNIMEAMSLSGSGLLKRTNGSTISVSEFENRLKSGASWDGPLQHDGLKIYVAELPAVMMSIVTIEEISPRSDKYWDKLLDIFSKEEDFIQAFVVDAEYDYWQNASDPLEYEAVGRDYKDLPLKSNGLPYPLERKVIDTSNNPSRVSIKSGYVEAIGARMWLSDLFWANSGGSRTSLMELGDEFAIESVAPGVIEIAYPAGSFQDEATSTAQFKLRDKVYGRA